MALAWVSHTRSGSSTNMAVRLIALRRGAKAAPLAFNFHLLLVRDMTISFFNFPMRAVGFFSPPDDLAHRQTLFFWNDYGKPEKQICFSC
jgi:hypothetical protein